MNMNKKNAMNILGNNMNPSSGGNDRINSGNNKIGIGGISGSGINSGNKNNNNNAPYKFGNNMGAVGLGGMGMGGMGMGGMGMPSNNIGMGRYKF